MFLVILVNGVYIIIYFDIYYIQDIDEYIYIYILEIN